MSGIYDDTFVMNCLDIASLLLIDNSGKERVVSFLKEDLLESSFKSNETKLLVLDLLFQLGQQGILDGEKKDDYVK